MVGKKRCAFAHSRVLCCTKLHRQHLQVKDDLVFPPTLKIVILKDDWVMTEVELGDTINIIGSFSSPTSISPIPTISLSSSLNTLIHHPDLLLPATTISTASKCTRKPLLSALLRSSADATPALVWGNMLHEVMQACLAAGEWSSGFLEDRIEQVVRDGLLDLVRIDVGIEAARVELRMRAQGLSKFSERFIGEEPKVRISTHKSSFFQKAN